MTKQELMEKLQAIPNNPTIYYCDMNFGGSSGQQVEDWWLDYTDGDITVNSVLWEPCD